MAREVPLQESACASMLRSNDTPAWSINGHTMIAEGPWLKNAGRVDVVPRSVAEELAKTLAWISDSEESTPERLKASEALRAYRAVYKAEADG